MKLLALALVAVPAVAAADVSIIDNGKTVAIDCAKDPRVSLIGNSLTVTLTGTCKKLDITGNHETVTGSAGDVYLCHPLLVHSPSWPHRGSGARMLSQPGIELVEPFALTDRAAAFPEEGVGAA